MTDRICWDCKHCHVDGGSPGYSEYTPGDPPTMACLKRHWRGCPESREDLRRSLQMAATCKDFEADPKP